MTATRSESDGFAVPQSAAISIAAAASTATSTSPPDEPV